MLGVCFWIGDFVFGLGVTIHVRNSIAVAMNVFNDEQLWISIFVFCVTNGETRNDNILLFFLTISRMFETSVAPVEWRNKHYNNRRAGTEKLRCVAGGKCSLA